MNLLKRQRDVILDNPDLENLYSFPQFPVFMGVTNALENEDLLVDMCWEISKGSGMIQLNPLLPLQVLYPESHGSGCVGSLWQKHHQSFASFIKLFQPQSVLEIGGAHGILSHEYKSFDSINWTIIEPNPTPFEGVTAKFIKGFFDDSFELDEPVDTVVHSHVFEHVYEPSQFIQHLSNFLQEGQKLIFSLPNMEVMLRRKYTNCINFEHTVFLTEPYIEYLLSKYGFRLLDKQYFKDDHSIFYAYVKDSNVDLKPLPDGIYEHNKALYLNYIQYHEELIADLNKKIDISLGDRPLYLFGAHIFAQYLIQFGLKTEKIISILDNDPNKQGKRLYGTKLKVASPKILADIESPVVILKAGVYNQEIMTDISENINSNTTFWE